MQEARFAPAALAALLVAAGCVVPQYDETRETLDDRTGTTVLAMGAPLEFYSPQPELGLKAASFAHLGALETNRMGTRRLMLWLSLLPGEMPGSQPAPATSQPVKLALVTDGGEFTPPRIDATAHDLGLSRPPFKRPADWAEDHYFDVTLEELRAMQSSAALALSISTSDGRMRRFEANNADRAGLARFIERLSGGA